MKVSVQRNLQTGQMFHVNMEHLFKAACVESAVPPVPVWVSSANKTCMIC